MKTRLLIVDDHPLVRRGLTAALTASIDLEVVAEASDADEAVSKARTVKPDIVILDISLPGKNGLEVLKQLQAEMPRVKVLILSAFPEKQYAIRCLSNGAKGYLTKQHASDEIVEAIRKVASGGKYVSPALADLLADEIGSKRTGLPHEQLSDREFQVLCLIGRGQTVSEVARTLSLSLSTVNTHRAHILEKMRMDTNAQLVRYVLDNNLVESPH